MSVDEHRGLDAVTIDIMVEAGRREEALKIVYHLQLGEVFQQMAPEHRYHQDKRKWRKTCSFRDVGYVREIDW
jgi:hypothetical protein